MKPLLRYFSILEGREEPKFVIAREKGLLDEKIKKAFGMLKNCELCEHECRVNRLKGEKGVCEVGDKMLINSYFDHYGEEFFLVPSFTVFFWSCNFNCVYCQNYSISKRLENPLEIEEEELARIIDKHKHCKNINFVGGDPSPQLPFILKTLKSVKIKLPVVWNSNFYMAEKSMEILKDVIDVYLSDFKYGNNKCAEKLSKIKNYLYVVRRNHSIAFNNGELVIRHLVLPGHFECCTKPILDWIAEKFKDKVIVNIMDQYRPCYHASNYEEMDRGVSEEEFKEVLEYAEKLKLRFGLNYIV